MDTLKPIIQGATWSYLHKVTIDGGGSVTACAAIAVAWKYDLADADADAAAEITWSMSDGANGITPIDDTSFECVLPASVTSGITPGALYVGIKYLLLDGTVIQEFGLNQATKCLPGVPFDVPA